jgi:hypothetical protein
MAIAKEVAQNIMRVRNRTDINFELQRISNESRVVQMNFVALACESLGIEPPFRNCVWTSVQNPYDVGRKVTDRHVAAAIDAIWKDDGVRVSWPGDNVRIDFARMHATGDI